MWHKPCRTFHPWCPCIKTRCLCLFKSHLVCMFNSLFCPTKMKTSALLEPICGRQIPLKCDGNVESVSTLRWRHNGCHSVSNHQPHNCLLNRLFRRISKKTSKLRVTGLCARNSPGTGEFPAQMASYAENVSIWWRHHDVTMSHDHAITWASINKPMDRGVGRIWTMQ